jgi:hypothetical protein
MSEIKITVHAKTRMARYEISEELVRATIQHADNIVNGYKGRTVFQKRLNDHLVRVIVEEHKGELIVITTYKSRVIRYAL